MSEDRLSLIARSLPVSYCPTHGPLQIVMFKRLPKCPHCGADTEEVEYVPAEQLRGAVEAITSAYEYLTDDGAPYFSEEAARRVRDELAHALGRFGGQ